MKVKRKVLFSMAILAGFTLLFAGTGFADIPAPPANQDMGVYDGVFNNLVEADCRLCHDDPTIIGPTPNSDRHHLLYGSPIPLGACSVNPGTCSATTSQVCSEDTDCPSGETCIIDDCLSDLDCDDSICSSTKPAYVCTDDIDCPDFNLGETCGEVCIGESVIPILDGDQDGFPDINYGCLNCHAQDTSGGTINFTVTSDCLACHVQISGKASVHHLTGMAQGTGDPADDIGDGGVGDCTPCHGALVDDIGDGHTIRTYTPSLVTPKPSGGAGLPLNSRFNGAGACNYCHDADTLPEHSIFANADTHHNTGVFQSETGVINDKICSWCHDMTNPSEYVIRRCEGCHGYESLHNIQADSPNAANIDTIVVGGEDYGYGHIGKDAGPGNSDCWGCHGFGFSSAYAPGSGTSAPYISGLDPLVMNAGTDTAVTLTGSAFTNLVGTTLFTSNVSITDANGTSTILTPDSITQGSLTVTIPGITAPGNYALRTVKGDAISNPVVFTVKPQVVITDVKCYKCLSSMVITGSNFGERPAGTEEYYSVMEGDRDLDIISWTDTEIQASGASCNGTVTINCMFGPVMWQQ